jgi:hypothetical protein
MALRVDSRYPRAVVRWLTCLFLFTVLSSSAPGFAQEQVTDAKPYFPQQLTAKDLLFTCAASSLTDLGRERRNYCAGFVSGVEETMRLREKQFSRDEDSSICVPSGTTARKLADVFIRYSSQSKADLTQPAAALVIKALQETFPCRQQAP